MKNWYGGACGSVGSDWCANGNDFVSGTDGNRETFYAYCAIVNTSTPLYRVQLRGGDGSSSGNVFATNRDGYFGPVCDDGWGKFEANTVCR